jgi:hypothetical protein
VRGAPTFWDRLTARVTPPTYVARVGQAERVEIVEDRGIRTHNTLRYRLAHWPVWAWVFFIVPGPLTFDLFRAGFDRRMALWLGTVFLGTGVAWMVGRMPGCEYIPYIMRFGDDRPNPLYRRVCYTFGWITIITFALLNLVGLALAIATGRWQLRQIYDAAYVPLAGAIGILGALGRLPRTRPSTKFEGYERRVFYGGVWTVASAQLVLWPLWRILPAGRGFDVLKLVVYVGLLIYTGDLARRGLLPRTRPIVPGELVESD